MSQVNVIRGRATIETTTEVKVLSVSEDEFGQFVELEVPGNPTIRLRAGDTLFVSASVEVSSDD